eukprot:s358_g7.t1
MVQRSVKILGAVSCSGRRRIHEDENRRVLAAKHAARLLGCCGFLLNTHLRYLKQFSLSKVNYGWVARGPTWTLSKSLWSCFWMSARRVRYSSPWLRALFLGGNLHLDITWATRLLAAVLRFRLSKSHGPGWSMSTGTCAHALRCWMKSKNFAEVPDVLVSVRAWLLEYWLVGEIDIGADFTSIRSGPMPRRRTRGDRIPQEPIRHVLPTPGEPLGYAFEDILYLFDMDAENASHCEIVRNLIRDTEERRKVCLTRPSDAPLGLMVTEPKENQALLVLQRESDVIQTWNRQNPHLQIEVGQGIWEVNGRSDPFEMYEELQHAETLQIMLKLKLTEAEQCQLDESLSELRVQRYRPLLRRSIIKEVETCAICYEDMNSADHEVVRLVACQHHFHPKCLSEWLDKSQGEMRCPMCSAKVCERDVKVPDTPGR